MTLDAAEAFLAAARTAFLGAAARDTPAGRMVRRAFAALDRPAVMRPPGASARLDACGHLGAALAAAAGSAVAAPLADAFRRIEPALRWHAAPNAAAAGRAFLAGHANARIVAADGPVVDDRVRIGVSLVAPEIVYPDHHHPPEEVYVVLSPGDWRQNDGPWRRREPGEMVHNPPGIVHAMRAGRQPLLAVWCLWSGAPDG